MSFNFSKNSNQVLFALLVLLSLTQVVVVLGEVDKPATRSEIIALAKKIGCDVSLVNSHGYNNRQARFSNFRRDMHFISIARLDQSKLDFLYKTCTDFHGMVETAFPNLETLKLAILEAKEMLTEIDKLIDSKRSPGNLENDEEFPNSGGLSAPFALATNLGIQLANTIIEKREIENLVLAREQIKSAVVFMISLWDQNQRNVKFENRPPYILLAPILVSVGIFVLGIKTGQKLKS
jgi:hypothetical protein